MPAGYDRAGGDPGRHGRTVVHQNRKAELVDPPSEGVTLLTRKPEHETALASILDRVIDHLRRYVVASPIQLDALALWVAHTHALEAADATPYIWITSAELESGKTRLLEVLRPLVARPWFTGRVTSAVLVRKVDAVKPTLLLDESDAAFGGDKEYAEVLRGVLNSGYARSGAYSVCVGQGTTLTYKDFATFCPKAIAGLGRLPSTVRSRSISIRLKRRAPSEEIEPHYERDVRPRAELIADNLETWADHEPTIATLSNARPDPPQTLGDRACDVWEPLLAIADLAGCGWPERARQAAGGLSGAMEPDEATLGIRLLTDCREAFDGRDRVPTRDLLDHLNGLEEASWGGWNAGAGIKPRELANKLRPYDIKSHDLRTAEGIRKGYRRSDFEDAWERYLPRTPDSKRDIRDIGSTKPKTAPSQARQDPLASRIESPEKPHGQADVADVADRSADIRAGGRCECGGDGCGRCLPPLHAVPRLPSIAELEELDLHEADNDTAVVVWDFTERAGELAAVGLPASDEEAA